MQIADFGLSRDLMNDNYYVSQGGKIPVKWTAPEALDYKKYSTASDVWSYVCLLYEIWSLGHNPFDNEKFSNREVCIRIIFFCILKHINMYATLIVKGMFYALLTTICTIHTMSCSCPFTDNTVCEGKKAIVPSSRMPTSHL